jgi:hypothetical protein
MSKLQKKIPQNKIDSTVAGLVSERNSERESVLRK